jgi:hypothetical protein
LTYDNAHLPADGKLQKRHLQLYLKRLRKNTGIKQVRYYAVGEYGSKFGRPHYHVLFFNVNHDNPHVRSAWSYGLVHVGRVQRASIGYVTKYVIQRRNKEDGFTLMSRRYGIGGMYLTDEMVAWHREDDRMYMVVDGKKVKLPRYYHDKIWYGEKLKRVKHKAKWDAIRKQRQIMRELIRDGYTMAQIRECQAVELALTPEKVKFTQTF